MMRNVVLQYWRVIACMCIVYHHIIYLFDGVWPPLGKELCVIPGMAYMLGEQAKTIGLTGFTFISGAVLFYGDRQIPFLKFVWRKICRILLPCLAFALAYKLLFPNLMFQNFPAAVNGTHLWYLPVIFLCIITVSTHFYSRYAFIIIGVLYMLAFVLKDIVHFRTISEYCYYFPVFYAGYVANAFLHNPQDILMRLSVKHNKIKVLGLLLIFIMMTLCYGRMLRYIGLIPNLYVVLIDVIMYAFLYVNTTQLNIPDDTKVQYLDNKYFMWGVIKILDRNCFAIYLMHQFILNLWGVYCADWINNKGFYIALPVVFASVFAVALPVSELYGYIKKCCSSIYQRI